MSKGSRDRTADLNKYRSSKLWDKKVPVFVSKAEERRYNANKKDKK